MPGKGPSRLDLVSLLLNLMEFHLGVDKPGLNKLDHAFILLQTSKLGQGITEVDICSVESIGLILGEAIVVLFERLDNVHTVDLVNSKLHPMVHPMDN